MLMIIPEENFNETEFSTVKTTMEEQGALLKVASRISALNIKGMEGMWVTSDLSWERISIDDWDVIILIGGSGTTKHFEDKNLHKLLNDAHEKKKWIAAICLSPMILAQAGILIGKQATCFPSIAENLKEMGVKVSNHKVEIDNDAKIITGNGPKAALLFSFKIVEMISGKKSEQARENE